MSSLRKLLLYVKDLFFSRGISFPLREAEDLICDVLSCDRAHLYSDDSHSLTDDRKTEILHRAERRATGEPSAYIHGSVRFYGCLLKVSPAVLIPRQETEILVDKIVKELKKSDLRGKVLWDLCTGSGCIGIALKKTFPELTVTISDISDEALAVARENALSNHVDLTCLTGDLFAPFRGMQADYIVCNPPYISLAEYALSEKEVVEFEPRIALVGGKTGLEIYTRLADEIPSYLRPSGRVWFEIGYRQGESLMNLFENRRWRKRYFENDWAGHDRFFFLENE